MSNGGEPAGIILCGGQSRRMGRDKASLAVAGETMLERTVRALSGVARPVVIAAAVGQKLPDAVLRWSSGDPTAPVGVQVVRDGIAAQGPLAGLAAAHAVLIGRAEVAFVCACDVPLLKPSVVVRMVELLNGFEAVVIEAHGRRHPLTAAYRVSALAKAGELLAQGERRAMALLDALRVRVIGPAELTSVDPDLSCLRNMNSPQEYAALVRDG